MAANSKNEDLCILCYTPSILLRSICTQEPTQKQEPEATQVHRNWTVKVKALPALFPIYN